MANYPNQSSESFAGDLVLLIIGIMLVAGVFIFLTTSWTSTPRGPEMAQNNTALPPSIIEVPAAPEPSAPPASQKTAPPADAPAYNP